MTDEERNDERSEEGAETTHDDTPAEEDAGEKGLGSESGGIGGEESPPNNPDPSTKGTRSGN